MEVERRRELNRVKMAAAEDDLVKARARHEQALLKASELAKIRKDERKRHVQQVEAKVQTNTSEVVKHLEAQDEARRQEREAMRVALTAKRERDLERIYSLKHEREARAEEMAEVREATRKQEKREKQEKAAARETALPLYAQIAQWLGTEPNSGLDVAQMCSPQEILESFPPDTFSKPSHAVWSPEEVIGLARAVQYCQRHSVHNRSTIFAACAASNFFHPAYAREEKHLARKWRELVQIRWGIALQLENEWKQHFG